jgi:ABC-2 type transport system permease protein
MAVFSFIMGFMFFSILQIYIAQTGQFNQFGMGKPPSMTDALVRPLFGNMNVVLMIMVPFVTMRLIAEEKRNNTIELLMTSPVTIGQIVLGKFLSSLWFVLSLVLLTMPFLVALAIATKPDWGVIAMAYTGTICMIAVYLAIGLMWSSTTENQIVAGVLTFGTVLFFWIINWISYGSGSETVLGSILSYLSVVSHYEDFSKGVFNTKDIVFYLSATGLFLFFSYKNLESYTWRS